MKKKSRETRKQGHVISSYNFVSTQKLGPRNSPRVLIILAMTKTTLSWARCHLATRKKIDFIFYINNGSLI